MELIYNPKHFLVIKVTNQEMADKLDSPCICDMCNGSAPDKWGYLLPVLSYWVCPKCYDEWYVNAIRYEEDVKYEVQHFFSYISSFLEYSLLNRIIVHLYLNYHLTDIKEYDGDVLDEKHYLIMAKIESDNIIVNGEREKVYIRKLVTKDVESLIKKGYKIYSTIVNDFSCALITY